ncbi:MULTISPECIES: hypothetical protein [unclassified Frankia]|uniref:hypothetical protein n=1 Tax=unclassified Frankia TaxID=2632575 RepID=UPI000A69C55D|nr:MULTISPECIES: hypothetical protein [unclassified Frankia]
MLSSAHNGDPVGVEPPGVGLVADGSVARAKRPLPAGRFDYVRAAAHSGGVPLFLMVIT